MDLSTKYLGLQLRTPLVASASPLSQEISGIRSLEDAGASAVVLYSLFEEQLRQEALELERDLNAGTESFAESITYFPRPSEFHTGPEGYLNHIRKAKDAVNIPIIASLNSSTLGGWTKFARQVEQAGADAIECNIYFIPTNLEILGSEVETIYADILREVKLSVHIPVAAKLSPFFSNFANMAKRLDQMGTDGLVLFNRFYQPDIDLEELEIKPNVLLSSPQELRLPLTWIGILYGRVRASLAATSGVYRSQDVLKLLMVGADVTMLCSALLRHGIGHLRHVEQGVQEWMEEHEYESVQQMQGSMSQLRCPDPGAFERAQYMRAVKGLEHVLTTS
ncbi:MAG: dihydroorotate dehydrogenase-like protein [Terriglobales bacterium]|jgi:dihydroorotate dehydrogenase (fumarate)